MNRAVEQRPEFPPILDDLENRRKHGLLSTTDCCPPFPTTNLEWLGLDDRKTVAIFAQRAM